MKRYSVLKDLHFWAVKYVTRLLLTPSPRVVRRRWGPVVLYLHNVRINLSNKYVY
jgi:hypothetical protein